MTKSVTRLLLADIHDAARRGVRSIVEANEEYHVVAESRDGREALRLAAELQPHIAIIEYGLPELNALDLAYALHRDEIRTAVLLYTVHDSPDLIRDVLQAGVRGFVLKSDPENSLLIALESLVSGTPYFSPTVLDVLLSNYIESRPSTLSDRLTSMERQIVQLVAEGRTNRRIGAHLALNPKTVETHRKSAMVKLKARNTAQLVRWAVRNNLVAA